jgi:hypothetical protein
MQFHKVSDFNVKIANVHRLNCEGIFCEITGKYLSLLLFLASNGFFMLFKSPFGFLSNFPSMSFDTDFANKTWSTTRPSQFVVNGKLLFNVQVIVIHTFPMKVEHVQA